VKQHNAKTKKTKKVVTYRIGIEASVIKQRVLRFMATFNPSSPATAEDTILELREEEEPAVRARAYSQENRNEHSELLETKTVLSHFGGVGGYALSQYVYPQSVFNDDADLTESEHDEDEDIEPFV
jgi:hypothetical protein